MDLFSRKEIIELEKKFQNEDFYNKDTFEVIEGSIPIVVSAPHSESQTRLNNIKQSEAITGAIAKILHRETGCYIMYKTKNDNDDANFDLIHPYKDKLINLIKEKNIKYAFDIHVMSPEREHQIDIGTDFGKNINNNRGLPNLIVTIFSKSINNVEIDKMFTASNDFTISSTIARETKVDAVQIEFNWRIVDAHDNFEDLNKVINNFIELIKKLISNN